MNSQEEDERRAGAMTEGIPVGADAGELEADGARGGDGDAEVRGEEGRFGETLLLDDAGVEH